MNKVQKTVHRWAKSALRGPDMAWASYRRLRKAMRMSYAVLEEIKREEEERK